jgi:hypothetical protein
LIGGLFVRAAPSRLGQGRVDHLGYIAHALKRAAYTSRHRGRQTFQGLLLLREIVPDGVERDHVGVVLNLLGKRIGEPCEAAHVHPHREVIEEEINAILRAELEGLESKGTALNLASARLER